MKYFNFFAAAIFLAVYAMGEIPPSERFNLWLVPFAIPFALILNIVLFVAACLMRQTTSLFLLVALVFGRSYLFSTIAIKPIFHARPADAETFSVLSYNVGDFNTGFFVGMTPREESRADSIQKRMIRWMMEAEADIQCYQEFPRLLHQSDVDLIEPFRSRGYYTYFSGADETHWANIGTLIVSRFPIVSFGDVLASDNGFNRISYIDTQVGSDTVRVVNVHLESMQLKSFNPRYAEDFESQRRDVKMIYRRLKIGVFERSRQIEELVAFIKKSPYPVICAGDFNELPYSHSYGVLRSQLRNAFEEAGKGFGFTYNGNTLSMLRIDNQFYSTRLRCMALETMHSVPYSDHFPLQGRYSLGNHSRK